MKGDVVFACVADPNKKFMDQAARLLMSLRWFGNSVANARFVFGTTGPLPEEVTSFFEHYGAEIVAIERYDASHGPGNKIALLQSPALSGHEIVVLLDCDTIIVQDPAPWLDVVGVAAKPADVPTLTLHHLEELFEYCGKPMPEARFTHELTGDPCIAYCNSGVLILQESCRRELAADWDGWNRKLFNPPDCLSFPRHHLNQASLALALEDSKIPFTPLSSELNMPTHLREDLYPDDWHRRDPVIIHYHGLAYPNGYIKPHYLRQCARRVESYNARLRAEGHVATPAAFEPARILDRVARRATTDNARPKVVVGSGWWSDEQPHEWTKGSPATQTIQFFDIWYRQVIRCLNPHCIVVTDSASPLKPDYRSYGPIEWIELDRNYGHPNDVRVGKVKTKYSGFTRSVVNGAMYALCCNAEFYVYVEQDCVLCGDDFLDAALGDAKEDILLGPPTRGGKGIYGRPAAAMLQQSLMIVRRAGLERFIEGILGSPWSDGEISPEVIMERRLKPFDLIGVPYGRSRPIDFGLPHFYAQHLDDTELEEFLQRIDAALVKSDFAYTV